MHGTAHLLDRRKTHRVALRHVTARCASSQSIGLYSVRDLSIGGALLEGEPLLQSGTRVRVQFSVPGTTESVVLHGTVLRSDAAVKLEAAVGFDILSADDEDMIEDVVLHQLAEQTLPQVLLATSSASERDLLARTLERLGYSILVAASASDVLALLAHPDTRPNAIVLGSQFAGGSGMALASFLADAYPNVRRVLVCRESIRRPGQALGVVHAILTKPWTDEVIKQALSG